MLQPIGICISALVAAYKQMAKPWPASHLHGAEVIDITIQVVGCDGRSSMTVSGVCDQPHISTDPMQVFPRRAKIRPDSAKIARHYVMSSGQLEFGPLLAGRDYQGYK